MNGPIARRLVAMVFVAGVLVVLRHFYLRSFKSCVGQLNVQKPE
jgi:hypothetical protein